MTIKETAILLIGLALIVSAGALPVNPSSICIGTVLVSKGRCP